MVIMMDSFLFITKDMETIEFSETVGKQPSALIKVTALELNKVSQNNPPTEYRIEEGDTIATSLIGVPVYYGVNWTGKHDRTGDSIGIVEKTKNAGERIFAWIRVINKELIDKLKKGTKFLFSVGGVAQFTEVVKKAGKVVMRMVGALCNHLQMVPSGVKVGFPNAKMEELVEINETVMLFGEEDDPVEIMIENAITLGIGIGMGRLRHI